MQIITPLTILALGAGALAEECTLIGYSETSRNILSGGGRGPPTMGKNDVGFQLFYVGGKKIASSSDNAIKIGGVTVPSKKLKLPKDVKWTPNFFISFKGCSVDYDGKNYKGTTNPAIKVCSSGVKGLNADSCASCAVDFECPGGLA